MNPDGFFLCADNPIANTDQNPMMAQALRVFALPEVQEARKKVAWMFRLAYGENVPAEAWPQFEEAMAEFAFNYVIKGASSDANFPRFGRDFMPPHRWNGVDIPGARMGGDNPNNCYRLAGIRHGASYEVHGRQFGKAPCHATFTLVKNYGTSMTVQTLELSQIACAPDGSFTITIDAHPANGRPNHMQTTEPVKFLFVRDTMNNWERESPLGLSIARMTPPDAAPLDELQVAQRAIDAMLEEVPLYYWFSRLFSGRPVNLMEPPAASGPLGGLLRQAGSQGWFRLADDEAMLVTLDPAGAVYADFVVHDWWFRTVQSWQRQTSLTAALMCPNPDGSLSFVVSHVDPGLHNWIDTCGLHEFLVLSRWQGLPSEQLRDGPHISCSLMKLSEIESALPPTTVRITPAQRAEQLAARGAGFARRLIC
jgi:hypothetical protein